MKNYLLILLTLIIINANGQDTKWPIFPLEVQKYLLYPNEDVCSVKKTNYEILKNLIGDTLIIENMGSRYFYSTKVAFTKEIPDTIWIKKRKKNNIEGKHYFLDTIYKSTPSTFCYPRTSIPIREECEFEDVIIILSVDSINCLCTFVNAITGKTGKWNPYINEVDLTSKSIAKKISSALINYPFYYIFNKDTIICNCSISSIGYHFSAIEIKSKNVFNFSYKYKDSFSHQSKEEKFILKEESMHEARRYRDYKILDIEDRFISKEVGDRMFFVRDSIKAANDSIEQAKLPFDSIFLCEGKVDESILKLAGASFPESYWNYKNAHVYVVSFVDDKYLDRYSVVYKGKCYSISKSYLECSDNNALNYLHERGAKGREAREQNALKADEKYWFKVRQNAKIAKEKSEREKKELLQELKMKEYFLIDFPSAVEKASSDYEGISFKFYNCYDKTVNYIYYKAVAYNSVGDQQYDLSGKSTKYLEIVGPIHPGDTNWEYNNEIFYDSEEKISKIRIEEMRIVFSDGTSQHFKSYSEILSHYKYANL